MSQRSSAFGGSTMSATSTSSRRFPSALERNNPDLRPSLLALVDTTKPISQQIDEIKAATQREAGLPSPRVASAGSDAFRRSLPGPPRSNASQSVRSFGSFSLTPSARRQTSGELGKGDDGLIVAMRKKAAEERRKKHLRESRASQAGSTVSRGAFGASRVSNSSFGISRIGLHSTTGSGIRPASSLMGSRSQPLPPTSTTSTPNTTAASPHRFEDLRYVQEVLARSRGTSAVSSRASSPEAPKPESPYASLAARARGALFENTREIQAQRAEKRKEEARKRETERERQRRDARLEMLAKLAAEEERERAAREEEVLSASNRKRDAAGTLRYSPEDMINNSVHPYGSEAKDPRKRSFSVDSPTKIPQQPAKRTRSSEPEGPNDERPRSIDRKLMPPPPAPSSLSQLASQSSTNTGFSGVFSQSATQQTTPSPPPIASSVDPAFSENDSISFHSTDASFGLGHEHMVVEEPEEINGDGEFGTFVEAARPVNHSVEPEIGMPVSLFMPSNAPLGGAPIARDFAYPGGPIFIPEPVHAGSDTEPDEDEEEEEEDEEGIEDKGPTEVKKGNKQPEVVSLLDSDDDEDNAEETFEGFGEYDEDEEGDDEDSDEEEESSSEEEEEEEESDTEDKSHDEEPAVIEVCSSPVPESVHEDDAPETNGSTAIIPDSFVAEGGASTSAAHTKAPDAQDVAGTQDNVRITRSRSSTAQSSSQEKVWMRDSGGRLMRSTSPETVDNASIAISNGHSDAPNSETTGSEPPIDPLLNTGVDTAAVAAAHAH